MHAAVDRGRRRADRMACMPKFQGQQNLRLFIPCLLCDICCQLHWLETIWDPQDMEGVVVHLREPALLLAISAVPFCRMREDNVTVGVAYSLGKAIS